MPRVDAIWADPVFQERLARIGELESMRPFCGHGAEHLFAVARLMRIRALEEGLELDREVVYAAALLHDIGRADQYETGEPHEAAGERIARDILGRLPERLRFSDAERAAILAAIRGHRGYSGRESLDDDLARLLYMCDKESRPCFCCAACAECNWPDEKKNLAIRG